MTKAPRPTSAMSAEEKEAKEAERHAPVSLPSGGSFDREDLQKGLEKVVDKHGSNRDAEVRKALENARTDADHTSEAPSGTLPGHKTIDAEVQLSAGTEVGTGKDRETVGAVIVREQRQVLDPDVKQDALSSASGGQPVVGNRSEILSVEDAEPAPEAAPAAAEPAAAGGGE